MTSTQNLTVLGRMLGE